MDGNVFPIIGELREMVFFDMIQCISQGHIAALVMVSIGFTVRCDVHQLRPWSFSRRKCRPQPAGEILAPNEQLFECDRL